MISAFDSRLAPLPHHSRPNHEPTVARRSRAASSDRPVTPIGPASRVDDEEVEQLAALALALEAGDVGLGLVERLVRAPGEPRRDRRVGGELQQPRRVVGRRVAERERRAGDQHACTQALARAASASKPHTDPVLACLYDVHGNLPALEAVLADLGEADR